MTTKKFWDTTSVRPDPDAILTPGSAAGAPIAHTPGRLAGTSHEWGDAPAAVKLAVVKKIMAACAKHGLDARDTAHVLAIVRMESGFNPDAASKDGPGIGLGQFGPAELAKHGVAPKKAFDVDAQADAVVKQFLKAKGKSHGDEAAIYAHFHGGALAHDKKLAQESILPKMHSILTQIEQTPALASIVNHAPEIAPHAAAPAPNGTKPTIMTMAKPAPATEAEMVKQAQTNMLHGGQEAKAAITAAPQVFKLLSLAENSPVRFQGLVHAVAPNAFVEFRLLGKDGQPTNNLVQVPWGLFDQPPSVGEKVKVSGHSGQELHAEPLEAPKRDRSLQLVNER